MSALAKAVLAELDDDALAELAARLAPFLPQPAAQDDGWLSTREAAAYAGCSVNSLHRAMAAREVAFTQDCPGGKAYFRRADIDAWRRGDTPANQRKRT